MTDTIHSTSWLEWKSTSSALNTLFYIEYNNVEPGAESTKRVTWEGFKVITDAAEAEPSTPRQIYVDEQDLAGLSYDMVIVSEGSGNFTTISKAIEVALDEKDLAILSYDMVAFLDSSGNFTTISEVIKVAPPKIVQIRPSWVQSTLGQVSPNRNSTESTLVENRPNSKSQPRSKQPKFVRLRRSRAQSKPDQCLTEGTIDFIFGDMTHVVLQDCDIQENVIIVQGRQVKNGSNGSVIQNCRIGTTFEFDVMKPNFQTYLWNTCSTLNTLFCREYNNVGPDAETSKRVT
ncbi:hypothetical protein V8G54_021132 [Vigna mungo]|uniref:Pectinesterase catalytic domain-containing protein n=1 Tax=Vigna mungo TaxID=3915 RepID=A0AAQ3RXE5_VIGMU